MILFFKSFRLITCIAYGDWYSSARTAVMLGRALMTTRIACSCNYRQNARPRFIIHILQAHSSCKKLPVRTQATGQKQNSSAAAGSTILLYNYAWICKVFKKKKTCNYTVMLRYISVWMQVRILCKT